MEAREKIIFTQNNEEMSQVKLVQKWKWKGVLRRL